VGVAFNEPSKRWHILFSNFFFRWQILKGAHGELKLLQFAGKDGQAAGFLESPLGDASLGYFPGFTEQSTTLCWYLYPILTRDFTFCFTC
jgi:hypothetical protein